ncbi:helix-turn-helix domain-containing protein [Clostridium sp. D53t1_180928_C8]|uniref:AraC family transcriptional regulator n=1 Tax=Clostridium sp. D53t1_180928_C8 TaxID=2787101 RepID=UPI0018AC68C3|nr:helix-turn-helix domain-containing protein [Clostridium sp. D53t1_180928_C8]
MSKNIKFDALQSQIVGDVPTHSIDLFLIHCGYHKCPPNYIFNHEELNEYHLHFVLNGKGTLIINNIKYNVKKNDIFILPKNYLVKYYADSTDPWEYIWVTFNGTLADTYLSYANITSETPVIHSNISNDVYLEYVDKMLETYESTYSSELRRASLLFELLSTLIESQNNSTSSDSNISEISNDVNIYSNISSNIHSYTESAINFIVKNYANTNVNDIANYIGINRCYLCTIFKKQLNISPQRYLLSFRMRKAEELIRTTQYTICDISNKVGYTDSLVFSKIFKKTYGLSPSNYRNQFLIKEKV